MKKKEAFEYMEGELGYVPTKMLFNELYPNNDDDIPLSFINSMIKVERIGRKPKQQMNITNSEVAKILNSILNKND
jgi:hypothetical protein